MSQFAIQHEEIAIKIFQNLSQLYGPYLNLVGQLCKYMFPINCHTSKESLVWNRLTAYCRH